MIKNRGVNMNMNVNGIGIGRAQNSKQVEFLNDIRDVGMGIIYGQTTGRIFIDVFEKYLDYVAVPTSYLKTLKEVSHLIEHEQCSPDTLLFKMGKHCPEIEYEDVPVVPYEEYDDEEDEDDEECLEVIKMSLDDDDIELLRRILEIDEE